MNVSKPKQLLQTAKFKFDINSYTYTIFKMNLRFQNICQEALHIDG